MKLKIVKVKPKGYILTKLSFSNTNLAKSYVKSLNSNFLLKQAKILELNLSKRKKKIISFAKDRKYLLKKKGNKYILLEEF